MRITNGIIQNNMMAHLNTNMGSLNKLMTQMSTLKKIQTPSDDPIIAGKSMKLRIDVNESEQHAANVEEAMSWMQTTESALTNMSDIIKTIKERCTQAANGGALTADDRLKISADIEQLYQQLQQETNVTYSGRYVFSGYKTDQPIYLDEAHALKEDVTLTGELELSGEVELQTDMTIEGPTTITQDLLDKDGNVLVAAGTTLAAGDTTTIPAGTTLAKGTKLPAGTTLPKGTELPAGMINPEVLENTNGQNINYEIGVNTTIDVNVTDMPAFLESFMADIEEIMTKIEGANAEPPTVTEEELNELFTGMIGNMDEHLSEISRMTSDIGSRQSRLEYTQSRLEEDKMNLTELLSNVEDVDIEEVFIEYNTQYMVYQSALQATSKVVVNTLADFLG